MKTRHELDTWISDFNSGYNYARYCYCKEVYSSTPVCYCKVVYSSIPVCYCKEVYSSIPVCYRDLEQ